MSEENDLGKQLEEMMLGDMEPREDRTEIDVHMSDFFDMRDFASMLVGDDFTFRYNPSTGIFSVLTNDLKDLQERIRSLKPSGTVRFVIEFNTYDEWGNEIE